MKCISSQSSLKHALGVFILFMACSQASLAALVPQDEVILGLPDGVKSFRLDTSIATEAERIEIFEFTIDDSGIDGFSATVESLSITSFASLTAEELAGLNLALAVSEPDSESVTITSGSWVGEVDETGKSSIEFSSLNSTIDDGSTLNLSVLAWFSNAAGVADTDTMQLVVRPENIVLGDDGSQMDAVISVHTGASGFQVSASKLVFDQQPGGSVSGKALETQPAVVAVDDWGNRDSDFTGKVRLQSEGVTVSNNEINADAGIARFTEFTIDANSDGDEYAFTASTPDRGDIEEVVSLPLVSDVKATRLIMQTREGDPELLLNQTQLFPGAVCVAAVDESGTIDRDFDADIRLELDKRIDLVSELDIAGDKDTAPDSVTLPPDDSASCTVSFDGLMLAVRSDSAMLFSELRAVLSMGSWSVNSDITIFFEDPEEITGVARGLSGLAGDKTVFVPGEHAVDGLKLDKDSDASISGEATESYSRGSLVVSIGNGAVTNEDILSFTSSSITRQSDDFGALLLNEEEEPFAVLGNNIANGEDLIIYFNDEATPELVESLIHGLVYTNKNAEHGVAGPRYIEITLHDQNGKSTSADVEVVVQTPLRAPTLTANNNRARFESGRAEPLELFNNARVSTVEYEQKLTSVSITMQSDKEIDNWGDAYFHVAHYYKLPISDGPKTVAFDADDQTWSLQLTESEDRKSIDIVLSGLNLDERTMNGLIDDFGVSGDDIKEEVKFDVSISEIADNGIGSGASKNTAQLSDVTATLSLVPADPGPDRVKISTTQDIPVNLSAVFKEIFIENKIDSFQFQFMSIVPESTDKPVVGSFGFYGDGVEVDPLFAGVDVDETDLDSVEAMRKLGLERLWMNGKVIGLVGTTAIATMDALFKEGAESETFFNGKDGRPLLVGFPGTEDVVWETLLELDGSPTDKLNSLSTVEKLFASLTYSAPQSGVYSFGFSLAGDFEGVGGYLSVIMDIEVNPAAVVAPPVIDSRIDNEGTLYNPIISPTGRINGGYLSGLVANAGTISDVNLTPGTRIEGGNLSGSITGNSMLPALIISSQLLPGTQVTNARFGKGNKFSPDVTFKGNISFEDPNQELPPGLDLTPLLLNVNHIRSDLHKEWIEQVVNLAASVRDDAGHNLAVLNDLLGQIERAVKQTPSLKLGDVSVVQKLMEGGVLEIAGDDFIASLLPVKVKTANIEDSNSGGAAITVSGSSVHFQTDGGVLIETVPTSLDPEALVAAAEALGVQVEFQGDGTVIFTDSSGNKAIAGIDPVATLSEAESQIEIPPSQQITGDAMQGFVHKLMHQTESDALPGLYEQKLLPTPYKFETELAPALDDMGVDAALLPGGGIEYIERETQQRLVGVPGYGLNELQDSLQSLENQPMFAPVGDLNGDGTTDFRMYYSDGSSQFQFIQPVEEDFLIRPNPVRSIPE